MKTTFAAVASTAFAGTSRNLLVQVTQKFGNATVSDTVGTPLTGGFTGMFNGDLPPMTTTNIQAMPKTTTKMSPIVGGFIVGTANALGDAAGKDVVSYMQGDKLAIKGYYANDGLAALVKCGVSTGLQSAVNGDNVGDIMKKSAVQALGCGGSAITKDLVSDAVSGVGTVGAAGIAGGAAQVVGDLIEGKTGNSACPTMSSFTQAALGTAVEQGVLAILGGPFTVVGLAIAEASTAISEGIQAAACANGQNSELDRIIGSAGGAAAGVAMAR